MSIFGAADILLPQVDSAEKWAVIACDQYTSQPEYWESVAKTVGDAPSALRLVLPEVYLGADNSAQAAQIADTMSDYLNRGIFKAYPGSYVYVERRLQNGSIRRGVVGALDLEAYDYHSGAATPVRATERTVEERIPARMAIRKLAPLELPHILLLCDDREQTLLESVAAEKGSLPQLYDLELMAGGGHLSGWLLSGKHAADFTARVVEYEQATARRYESVGMAPLLYAVGDGNHSLAGAKACWETLKRENPGADLSAHPARYALLELENLHDESQQFEPIHRIVKQTDPAVLLAALLDAVCTDSGYPVKWYAEGKSGTLYLNPAKGDLPVGILQTFLDAYLPQAGGSIDYIHGDDVLYDLAAAPGCVGFQLEAIPKESFFTGIAHDGVLPRKTFSMGHACEKRYYLEARKIV